MNTVFILGAGASYGDNLLVKDKTIKATKPVQPPLINGFFNKEMFTKINYTPDEAESDFPDAFEWIRTDFSNIVDETRVGDAKWNSLNIEEIFTAVELRREFESPESSKGANLLIIRNQLVAYIMSILGLCTYNCYGEFSRRLVSKLDGNDSLFTLNWDLLLDEAFEESGGKPHLNNFLASRYAHEISYTSAGTGLFLKLHGSLNWFLCTNSKCKFASEIRIERDTQYCLSRVCGDRTSSGIFTIAVPCPRCGSDTNPFIVPPLVRKPITENSTIRSIWGLARRKLELAERLVLIGFSAAATDFFIGWLVRSAIMDKGEYMEVVVVNPANEDEDFVKRMRKLSPYKLNTDYKYFSDLDKFI